MEPMTPEQLRAISSVVNQPKRDFVVVFRDQWGNDKTETVAAHYIDFVGRENVEPGVTFYVYVFSAVAGQPIAQLVRFIAAVNSINAEPVGDTIYVSQPSTLVLN